MVRASLEIGNSNQELMEKPGRKKWKIWLSGMVIFLVIVVIVVAAVILFTVSKKEPFEDFLQDPNGISLEDIMRGKLSPHRFNGTWISDEDILYTNISTGSLSVYNFITGKETELLSSENQILLSALDQQLSADKKYLLLALNYRKLFRHSYRAQYIAINMETGDQLLVSPNSNDTYLELAVWGPEGNSIAFVQNNNIFYRSSITSPTVQISTNGVPGTIYNGVPDWVYEEEVFESNVAMWFSPDGSHLAYGSFNDTLGREMPISFYGHPEDPDAQYPRTLTVRYPKAGTTNPTANVVLVNLQSDPVELFALPVPPSLYEPILATVTFATNSSVVIVWTNRVQNESLTYLCSTECHEVFHYKEENGWVDMVRPLIFKSNGTAFYTILPEKIKNDHWKQIALLSQDVNGGMWNTSFVTNVPNTVKELLHWDENAQLLWYMATSVEDSAFQHLYSVTVDGKINCFTCNVTHSSGSQCLYNEAVMSTGGSFITVSCLGPQIPEIYIYSKNGTKIMDWETNHKISEFISNKNTPVIRRFAIQIAGDNLPPAQVTLMTPPNVDLSGAKKYPMLVYVYGGPDSYQVLERWQIDWAASLVIRWNITLAQIDGRGSGLKGHNNLFSVYRNLGTVEINDQINATRHLQKSLNYIDPERTCIWGWSYGGYAAALSLARGGNTFKCAISVAPVTDWRYYDSIYTERYMGLPNQSDNLIGYKASQLNTPEVAAALSKKKYMLIHGTLDDNVHFQQSLMLSRLLQLKDVQFTQMSYPDEDHSLIGVKPHLYHSMEKFLMTNLLSKPENV